MQANQAQTVSTVPTFMSKHDVAKVTTLGVTTVLAEVRAGRFPKPIKLTRGRSGWLSSEVAEWMAKRVADSRRVK